MMGDRTPFYGWKTSAAVIQVLNMQCYNLNILNI